MWRVKISIAVSKFKKIRIYMYIITIIYFKIIIGFYSLLLYKYTTCIKWHIDKIKKKGVMKNIQKNSMMC